MFKITMTLFAAALAATPALAQSDADMWRTTAFQAVTESDVAAHATQGTMTIGNDGQIHLGLVASTGPSRPIAASKPKPKRGAVSAERQKTQDIRGLPLQTFAPYILCSEKENIDYIVGNGDGGWGKRFNETGCRFYVPSAQNFIVKRHLGSREVALMRDGQTTKGCITVFETEVKAGAEKLHAFMAAVRQNSTLGANAGCGGLPNA